MKKLTEFKDDEAMDVLVEILEPAVELSTDSEFVSAMRGDKKKNQKPDRIKAVKIAITDHRDAVVKIMAVLNETPVEEFHYNLLTLPKMVLTILNDKELVDFFTSQGEKDSGNVSGSAMENIEEDQSIS